MSSARHATALKPSLIGAGAQPERTHAHHVDRLTGINAGIGGLAFGLPMICNKRTNPVFGNATDAELFITRLLEIGEPRKPQLSL